MKQHYKVTVEEMHGTQVRYEFPLPVEASLVFKYYEGDEVVLDVLAKMVDSVKIAQ